MSSRLNKNSVAEEPVRKTSQPLLPLHKNNKPEAYDIFPAYPLEGNKIYEGFDQLADFIAKHKTVIIDGYVGVRWDNFKQELNKRLSAKKLTVNIEETKNWFYSEAEIDELAAPYLGEPEDVWGKRTDKSLSDFFDPGKINKAQIDEEAAINIVIGCGAALSGWEAPIIYVDLPKNELQYRMRAGITTNLGKSAPEEATQMYKRFYFVDWVVLNQHKKAILDKIAVIVDEQRPDNISWMHGTDFRAALDKMSKTIFRVRPWFEAGAWGGQWMKKHLPGINKAEVNYAWSFELITPENGLVLESSKLLMEISFDWLMFAHKDAVIGERYTPEFGDEFPIRFDFLDTVKGGNLSIQCHPSLKYIRENFGEHITQDETYYILDAEEDAGVYLGFQEAINPQYFRQELEKSNRDNTPIEISKYVQLHPARKHDLFLIPNGTIHSAGAGNLVLEISATPYIFTFKMYDWLRLDLNGRPRPINIAHAFNNLHFDRKGAAVEKELISHPKLLEQGDDWQLIHLPTHPQHFYDVHRYEFLTEVKVETKGSCHVLMLVEGSAIKVKTAEGFCQKFHYAETIVIPAAAGSYTIINESQTPVKVVKAFLK